MIVDFEIQSHENGLQGVGAVFGATKKGGHLLRPFRAAAEAPPARFIQRGQDNIHKGQDNRTNTFIQHSQTNTALPTPTATGSLRPADNEARPHERASAVRAGPSSNGVMSDTQLHTSDWQLQTVARCC